MSKLSKALTDRGHDVTAWCCTVEALPVRWRPPDFMDVVIERARSRPANRNLERASVLFSLLPESAWMMRSEAMIRRIRRLRTGDFDVILLQQAHAAALLPELRATRIPLVLMTENVEHDVRRQQASYTPWSRARVRILLDVVRLRRLEGRALQGVDVATAVSERDGERLAALRPRRRLTLVPNGVDLSFFEWRDHTANNANALLMCGHLGYPPNVDGVNWMVHRVMPEVRQIVPDATLSLVGMAAGPRVAALHSPRSGIRYVGEVADVRPFMSAADVFVIPLRIGGGTRLKALEALAAGVPIVTTSVGIEGLGAAQAGVVQVADTPDTFAASIAQLLQDRSVRGRLSRQGREFVETRYSWERIATGLEHLIAQVAS